MRPISPQAYDGNGLVWDIAQDERGLLYIASSYGLQQYDGARWRFLPVATRTTPFAIARDTAGRLHIGAQDELGYYRPDSLGRLQYRSLRSQVPDTHRPTGDVLLVVATDAAVFFQAEPGLLRWRNGEMRAVTDTTGRLVECRDTAFWQAPGGRLHRVEDTTLAPVAGGARFSGTTIDSALPGADGGCEIVTEEAGRFALTDTGVQKRPLPGGPMEAPIVATARGPDGSLAIATEWTLRLIGPNGTRHRLTRDGGQMPGEIKQLYVSQRQALWVATTDGFVRVAWPDPVTLLREPPPLQSITGQITRHDGTLVAGTEQGLWRIGRDTIRHLASDGHVYGLISTPAGLLASGTEGIFVYREERVRFLIEEGRGYAVQRSRRDSTVVYAGFLSGELVRLRRRGGRWRVADRTDRIEAPIPTIGQATDGALWLGTGHRGIVRLGPPLEDLDAAPIARFDTTDGLPNPGFNFITQLGDSVRFPTQEGLYQFTGAAFEPDSRFAPVYTDDVKNSWFAEMGSEGGVWMDFGGHKLGVARGWPGDSVRWAARPFRRVADVGDVWSIYPDPRRDSLVWFGADGALVRYDRRLQRYGGHNQFFRTLVRGVQTREDTLFSGDIDASALPAPIAPEHNRLRFEFGSTSYEQIDGPIHNWDRPRQYRWRLDGFDSDWSDWTTEAHADYTGLSPGSYTIHVEARNLYQNVGQEAALSFTILPPWYRTWWAYGLYGLLALGLLAGAVRWRTYRLRRRQEQLEQTVAERTKEVRRQRDQLEEQAERLQELDEAKSRFFANVSHEFRTPLTLIRGPVQEVRERLRRRNGGLDEATEQLAVVERNTDRLRRLVDQLLALARMDAGTYELAARPIDLGAETKRIARTFEPLAERHNLTFTVDVEEAPEGDLAPVHADREALEHILGNLLSNAIKFTPERGTVTVTVTGEPDRVTVAVADTGPGIPDDQQDAIFDRFAQVEEGPTGDQEGLGIGLAFAADLVDLHGGTITLDSTEGEGTTVTVALPRGADHLADDQRAPAPSTDETSAPHTDASTPNAQSAPPNAAPAIPDGADAADTPAPSVDDAPDPASSKLVLVVDDNADVRRYVRSVLAPDYAVIEAADGRDGLARAREAMPDCILADVMMPTMDGVAMVRHLRQDPTTEGIPVVMLTARAGTEHEIEGLEAGADDYVTKPFDADVLRARVAGMIEVRQRLRRRIRAELRRRSGDGQAGKRAEEGAPESDGPVADRAGGDQTADTAPPRLVVPSASEEEPDFVREVRSAIEEHLADPDLSVEELASAVAVSRSTLYRRLKEHVDQTPSQFIRQVRIEHGARLLREGEGTVSEVAYAVGFESLSYFSNQFREHKGQSPSAYVEAVE